MIIKTTLLWSMLVLLVTIITEAESSTFVCPPAAAVFPCSCDATKSPTGLVIDCARKRLTDSKLGQVLDAFFLSNVSSVVEFTASHNAKLTRVPKQISKFKTLKIVDLSYNRKIRSIPSDVFHFPLASSINIDLSFNSITSIPSGAFKFPSASDISILLYSNEIKTIQSGLFDFPSALSVDIWLSKNQITTIPYGLFHFPSALDIKIGLLSNQISKIPSDTFNFPRASNISIFLSSNEISYIPPGLFNFPSASNVNLYLDKNAIYTILPGTFQDKYGRINLDNNQLTRFESNVFESTLRNMEYNDGYLTMSGNSIICSFDPCSLAWLVRDNRDLLKRVSGGSCWDLSVAIADLNPLDYANC